MIQNFSNMSNKNSVKTYNVNSVHHVNISLHYIFTCNIGLINELTLISSVSHRESQGISGTMMYIVML